MEIKIGCILWAAVPDKNGYVKDRPLVVIGVSEDRALPLVCCCISTADKSPRPATYVPVPWDRTGRSGTALREPSFAVADWIVEVPRDKCRRIGGKLSARQLTHLLDVIAGDPRATGRQMIHGAFDPSARRVRRRHQIRTLEAA